jgi:hypothetical protein
LFVPETNGSAKIARFFFSALGLQAIGYSPFGLDYTRVHPQQAPGTENSFLDPTAQNYRLIGPMMRDIARLISRESCRQLRKRKARSRKHSISEPGTP